MANEALTNEAVKVSGTPKSGTKESGSSMTASSALCGLVYQSGFGNEFATEAVAGALPVGQNAPQQVALGLYAEQLSGTSFTAPRGLNRRTWAYRIRPSVMHKPYRQIASGQIVSGLLRSSPFNEVAATPNQMRWNPLPVPHSATDFLGGLRTLAGNGDLAMHSGVAIHLYAANRSLEAVPGEIAVLPRGIKFRVELKEAEARGYICENYGAGFRLPDLGPIGANCLANSRDFQTPVAAFEDIE